ncbi:hypothetical protein ACIP5U_39105 [Streptomyces sp. NPDC088788]|uniref:hypothetical protein n=1 Tax=Streptomyces sp. NPDC088788 TaxID=3365898 RepID=UPI00382EF9B8
MTTRKETGRLYENGDREWETKAAPAQVKAHQCPGTAGTRQGDPHGLNYAAANTGWVSVGTD